MGYYSIAMPHSTNNLASYGQFHSRSLTSRPIARYLRGSCVMTENSNQPEKHDVFLGGQASAPADGVVLTGLDRVKQMLVIGGAEQKIDALLDAFQYGQQGLDLVIQALEDKLKEVRAAAYLLLQESAEFRVKQALREYNTYKVFDCLHTLEGNREIPSYFAISSDEKTLRSSCYYICNVWNLEKGQLIDAIVLDFPNPENCDYSCSYTFTPDGQTIVVLNKNDGSIVVSNMHTGYRIRTSAEYHKSCFTISADGQTLVCGNSYSANNSNLERSIKVWDVQTGQVVRTLHGGHTGKVDRVLISPDGQILTSITRSHDSLHGMYDIIIKVWNLSTGQELYTFNMPLGIQDRTLSLIVSSDGQTVVSGSMQGSIKVWDVHTQQIICTLQGGAPITLSHDGKVLVSYSETEVNNNSGYVTGRMLASSKIKVWDVQTGQELCTLRGCFPITLSRDQKVLVSGGAEYTIKLWDAQTGQEFCTLPGHPSSLDLIVISPDGQTIVSYGMNTSSFDNASIKVWGVR